MAKKKNLVVDDVLWVYRNMDKAAPEDAPRGSAGVLLRWVKESKANRSQFIRRVMGMDLEQGKEEEKKEEYKETCEEALLALLNRWKEEMECPTGTASSPKDSKKTSAGAIV